MKVEIDTSKVRLVAKAIRTKQGEIDKELTENIIPSINSLSSRYVHINKESVVEEINKVFSDLDTRLNSLIEILNNNVAGGFEELGEAIQYSFNDEFKTQFEELINNNDD